jgi:hypothetical protein
MRYLKLYPLFALLCAGCRSHAPPMAPTDRYTSYEVTLACACPISWYCATDSCICTVNTTGTVVNSVMMRCGQRPDWFFPRGETSGQQGAPGGRGDGK